MARLRKLKLCLLVVPLVFFLIPKGAMGQQGEICIVPTVTKDAQDIDKWKPKLTISAESEEIAPGGSVNLLVVGGCQESYSWEVTGIGYSLTPTNPPGNDPSRMTLECAPGT